MTRNKNQMPSTAITAVTVSPEQQQVESTAIVENRLVVSECVVTLPIVAVVDDQSYLSTDLNVRALSQKQRRNMKALLRGLSQTGATLANGKVVRDKGDVVRWFLEQF